jgi:hypothetical protein
LKSSATRAGEVAISLQRQLWALCLRATGGLPVPDNFNSPIIAYIPHIFSGDLAHWQLLTTFPQFWRCRPDYIEISNYRISLTSKSFKPSFCFDRIKYHDVDKRFGQLTDDNPAASRQKIHWNDYRILQRKKGEHAVGVTAEAALNDATMTTRTKSFTFVIM